MKKLKKYFSNKEGSETDSFTMLWGPQNHFSGAMALVAPYVNFTEGLQNDDAPANLGWGIDNRTVGWGSSKQTNITTNWEQDPKADSNPYLAIAATLACVWLGLGKKNPINPK